MAARPKAPEDRNNLGTTLRTFLERTEALDEEIANARAIQKDIVREVKAAGLDVKTYRRLVAVRRKDPEALREEEELLDTYRHAVGM